MDFGPLQLMVIGFDDPKFDGSIVREVARLSDAGVARLVDALVVSKDDDGEVTAVLTTELSVPEMEDLGATIGALIGLGLGGEEGAEVGAAFGEEAGADGHLLDDLDLVDVIDEIEPGTTAAVVLLEHRWAIPLRDAIIAANGVPVLDMWIHPDELVALGAAAR